METQGVTVTLTIVQNAQGKISGTLSSTKGMLIQVNGQIDEDVAVGTYYDNKGGIYFEAHLKENQLLLILIEPDFNNIPDYSKVRQLALTKQEIETIFEDPLKSPIVDSLAANEISDPNWGFKF